jgi:hypothetical protein
MILSNSKMNIEEYTCSGVLYALIIVNKLSLLTTADVRTTQKNMM